MHNVIYIQGSHQGGTKAPIVSPHVQGDPGVQGGPGPKLAALAITLHIWQYNLSGPVHTRAMRDTCDGYANLAFLWSVWPFTYSPPRLFNGGNGGSRGGRKKKGSCTSDRAMHGSCRSTPTNGPIAKYACLFCVAVVEEPRCRTSWSAPGLIASSLRSWC